MQRIQYHRYSGPEEMRLETYELPALGEHDPRAVPARRHRKAGSLRGALRTTRLTQRQDRFSNQRAIESRILKSNLLELTGAVVMFVGWRTEIQAIWNCAR
jgi:hypothetical protein